MISGIAPVKTRGKLVSNQVALTNGTAISYLTNYAFAGSQSWRWIFAMDGGGPGGEKPDTRLGSLRFPSAGD